MGTITPSLRGHCITRLKVDGVLPYLNPGVFQDQQAYSESPSRSPGKRQGNLKGHIWCKQLGVSRPAWRTMLRLVDAVAGLLVKSGALYWVKATLALSRQGNCGYAELVAVLG